MTAGANPVDVDITQVTITFSNGTTQTRTGAPIVRLSASGSSTVDLPSATLPAGSYTSSATVTANVTGSPGNPVGPVTCPGAHTSGNRPIIKVNNGDVWSGGVFAKGIAGSQTCSASSTSPLPNGRILGFNGAVGSFVGSGAQLAAYAAGQIQGFYTNAINTSAQPIGASLSFANTANVDPLNVENGRAGGNFTTVENCITDYYATGLRADATATGAGTTSIATLEPLAGDQVVINGNLTLDGITGYGGKLSVFVTGNVYIRSNVTLADSYINRSAIPFFGLFVRGNIFISPDVSILEGIYVAQPQLSDPANPSTSTFTANTGTIYTCGSSSFSPITEDGIGSSELVAAGCSNTTLTFNGSVIAKRIKLLRTIGNITGPVAETFNALPELYLVTDPPFNTPEAFYDSAATLPPVL